LHGNANLTSSGFLFGGQLGYNWQTGPWVWGVEADIQWANIKGDVSANASGPGGSLGLSAGSELEWFGTVRGRVGYAWDRVMLYATGGYAYGSVNTWANASLTGEGNFSFSRSNTKNGWTVGGGLEYAMTPNLMFKTEYLYMDLGTSTVYSIPEFRISEDTTVHLVRAGLNWKFGGVW
jgi:outer membrane immunogenic protein